MGGEQPTAADLQVGAGIALLLTFGDIADRVGAHECARVARRWFPDYPGAHAGGGAPAGVARRGRPPCRWLARLGRAGSGRLNGGRWGEG